MVDHRGRTAHHGPVAAVVAEGRGDVADEPAPPRERRVVAHDRGVPEPALRGQGREPLSGVEVPREPDPVDDVDLAQRPALAPVLHDVVDEREERREPGVARHEEEVGLVIRVEYEVGTDRGADAHDVTGPDLGHERHTHEAAGVHGDLDVDGAVGTRCVGRREEPPGPVDLRDAHRHRLAREVGNGCLGPQGERGDLAAHAGLADDFGVPPCRLLALGLLGGLDHRRGHDAVGGRPVRGHLGGPPVLEEVRQGPEQGGAHGVVVLGDDREPTVVAPELLDERHD